MPMGRKLIHTDSYYMRHREHLKALGRAYYQKNRVALLVEAREARRSKTGNSTPSSKRAWRKYETLWERVVRHGWTVSPDSCWVWTSSKRGKYGKVRSNGADKTVHRVSWEHHYGPIPAGLFVCHKCDNPPCLNPEHLFLGDSAANARDMALKGRSLIGLRNHKAKLTEEQVRTIRSRFANGVIPKGSFRATAREFGINTHTLRDLLTRVTWKHLT